MQATPSDHPYSMYVEQSRVVFKLLMGERSERSGRRSDAYRIVWVMAYVHVDEKKKKDKGTEVHTNPSTLGLSRAIANSGYRYI